MRRSALLPLASLALAAASGCTCGGGARLTFQVPPDRALAGYPLSPSVQVAVVDGSGNVLKTAAVEVTVALEGSDAPLGGTVNVPVRDGVATFGDLVITRAGAYRLQATAPGCEPVTRDFIVAPGYPARLGLRTAPGDSLAGGPIAPAPQVAIEDRFGNPAVGATDPISVAVASGPSTALQGTRTVVPQSGTATFSDLSLGAVGQYTLAFSATGVQGVTSPPFQIRVGPPAGVRFVTQPSTVVAGASISPPVVVELVDLGGNPTNGAVSVTLSVQGGLPGAVLQGGGPVAVSGGRATFGALSVNRAPASYTLLASAPGLASATSDSFDVRAGPPDHLAWVTQPRTANVRQPVQPAVQAAVVDALGNVSATTATISVSLAQAPSGAQLSGTTLGQTTTGMVTFNDLRLEPRGQYALRAESPPYPAVVSATFTVYEPLMVYTDPATFRPIALRRNPASTPSQVVLDLVVQQPQLAYSAALNLPLEVSQVSAVAPLITAGPALNPGTGVVAMGATLGGVGRLSGVLSAGISQKAAGAGSNNQDRSIATGQVLFTLRLEPSPTATGGVVFDGATLLSDPRFRAALLDRQDNVVVPGTSFGIGRLEIQLQ